MDKTWIELRLIALHQQRQLPSVRAYPWKLRRINDEIIDMEKLLRMFNVDTEQGSGNAAQATSLPEP